MNTQTITYIKKSTVSFIDLCNSFGMTKDNGGRWDTTANTQAWVKEYLKFYRSPSRAFPHSHSKAMLSQKFAKELCVQDPELAVKLGVAE